MIIVLFVWAFTLLCLFGMGWLVVGWSGGRSPDRYNSDHPFLICFAGLILVTVLTTCWNYFAPVGMVLNLLVALAAGLVLVMHRRGVSAYLKHWKDRWRSLGLPAQLCIAAIFLIALLKSIAPSEMLDEGDYYLPYIRWMEHYRVIPGLANITDRFGFNSSFHLASAFFGLSWLVPGGSYELNGLLLLLFASWCLGALRRVLKPGSPILMSDVMKLFCLFFLMRNMITSSASDLSNMALTETVLVLFVQKIEQRSVDRADGTYYLIVAGALFVATIKLSSILIGSVPAYLTLRILTAGRSVAWGKLIALSCLVALPWLGRFPVLTGYLVYPLYQVDLIDVDWKVPQATAEREYHYVSEFAKTNARPEDSIRLAEHRNMLAWAPVWFARENMLNRGMALSMLAAVLVLVPFGLFRLRWSWLHHRDLLALGCILIVCSVVWFLQNPAMRFGWAWGIILLAFSLHLALRSARARELLRRGTLALLILSLAQNTIKTGIESAPTLATSLVAPAPSSGEQARTAQLGPLTVRVSTTRQCWGEQPPCLPADHDPGLEPRGDSVLDGFRIAQH